MSVGGACLRLTATVLYALEFCCAAIILGIYSYFLSVLADRDLHIPKWEKAVEGMSGVAVLYLICAVILTCFLGGIRFFAFLAIVFDILLCGAFVAIAVLTRDGADSCDASTVHTPLGDGSPSAKNGYGSNGFGTSSGENVTYSASLGTVCKLNKACFAVAIVGAVLFLISAVVQLWVSRHHQKEKRFGPGPSNGYTSGTGRKFWQRKPKTTRDAELGAAGAGGYAAAKNPDVRPSHETAYTGSTVGAGNTATYDAAGKPVEHAGWNTAPTGTGVGGGYGGANPYGYDTTTGVAGTGRTATNY